MVEKILFLGAGSKSDPGFDGVSIGGEPYKNYMAERGIKVVDNVIESCHGCYDLMTNYSQQMQSFVENGNRAVAVLEGGLLFGLPSIQATQTTFPIISVPTDLVAYTGFMVPSGHAAIAGVGVSKGQEQKVKALSLAERILNLGAPGVNVLSDPGGNLREELSKLKIPYYEKEFQRGALSLAYGSDNLDLLQSSRFSGCSLVWVDLGGDVNSWYYLREAEERHHKDAYNSVPSAQVRGVKNLAIFAAKVLSFQIPELRSKLESIADKKRSSYDERDLAGELRGK